MTTSPNSRPVPKRGGQRDASGRQGKGERTNFAFGIAQISPASFPGHIKSILSLLRTEEDTRKGGKSEPGESVALRRTEEKRFVRTHTDELRARSRQMISNSRRYEARRRRDRVSRWPKEEQTGLQELCDLCIRKEEFGPGRVPSPAQDRRSSCGIDLELP